MRQPRRVSRHLARQPFGIRRAVRCPSLRTRRGPLPVPHDTSRHDLVPATPGLARQARGPSRALAASLAVSCTLPLRALPRSWRTGAYAMRRPTTLLLCSEALAQLQFAAFTRRALRPGNVARGDRCVRGTLTPRHHAGTNDLLSKALDATGRKAALAPRHYRIAPPGDMPRKATSAASDRRNGSDGALRLGPPARRTPPQRGSWSRWRGSEISASGHLEGMQHLNVHICAAGEARFWFHALRKCFISAADRGLMLLASFTKRLGQSLRPQDVRPRATPLTRPWGSCATPPSTSPPRLTSSFALADRRPWPARPETGSGAGRAGQPEIGSTRTAA